MNIQAAGQPGLNPLILLRFPKDLILLRLPKDLPPEQATQGLSGGDLGRCVRCLTLNNTPQCTWSHPSPHLSPPPQTRAVRALARAHTGAHVCTHTGTGMRAHPSTKSSENHRPGNGGAPPSRVGGWAICWGNNLGSTAWPLLVL